MNSKTLGVVQRQKATNMGNQLNRPDGMEGQGVEYLIANRNERVTRRWDEFARNVSSDEKSRPMIVNELQRFLNVACKYPWTHTSINGIQIYWEPQKPFFIRFQVGGFTASVKGNDILTEATFLTTERNVHFSNLNGEDVYESCTLELNTWEESAKEKLAVILKHANDENNPYRAIDKKTLYRQLELEQLTDKIRNFEQNVTGFYVSEEDKEKNGIDGDDKTYKDCIPQEGIETFTKECVYIYIRCLWMCTNKQKNREKKVKNLH